ncbi:MAG TPA: cation-transporting ATPase [Candidatus Jacksonbacteria bacterium]|nr:cation-transporting ATPase [Candidatus Jacksonbacteria bacterium]
MDTKPQKYLESMRYSFFTSKTKLELYEELKTSDCGLSTNEAHRRLKGRSGIGLHSAKTSVLSLFARQFTSPFVYLLIGAMIIALLLRDFVNAAMIFAFLAINAALGFYQEHRSDRALSFLQKYVPTLSRVIRDSKEKIVPSCELVVGDVVLAHPGDALYADVRFISVEHLIVDESALTGESAPVFKIADRLPNAVVDIYGAQNIGFSGSAIVSGEGRGIVVAIRADTAVGEIERVTRSLDRRSTFEKAIGRLSAFVLRLTVVTLAFVFAANLIIKGERADIGELLIFSIALAVTVIPEALPLVTTFSLSRGALRLAKNKVVVKRLSAIEDLGSIEVLCTDKTGTLTENKMTLYEARPYGGGDDSARDRLLLYGLIGLEESGRKKHVKIQSSNAFEEAVKNAASDIIIKDAKTYKIITEIPFDPERRRATILAERDGKRELVVRGAPEEILSRLCGFSDSAQREIMDWAESEGKSGRRVIAVAKIDDREISENLQDEERELSYVGAVSFHDALKPSADEAIAKAKHLGVIVKMLTGDSPEVACSVAREIGLIGQNDEVITGAAFEAMAGSEQKEAVFRSHVFARVTPIQKFKIVQLLEQKYEVGFLGEGINDAPALKAANVALVVGDALPAARAVADIILLKRSLNVIIDGIEEGRAVFANTVKYIKATLASNFGNFYAVAIASLLVDFLPMLPLQILLVNLLSDFPMIAIATDTVDKQELRRPKHYDVRDIALLATTLGIVSSVFDFIFFGLFYRLGAATLQTNWFIASILTELLFLFSIRSRGFFLKAKRASTVLIILSLSAAIATVAIPFTSIGRETFGFIEPVSSHMAWIFGLLICYFIITEIVKLLYYRFLVHET